MSTPGLNALLDSAALVDVSARGRIRVTGDDRARLLHAMTTNHVQGLKPGEGQYTFFLNAQGQIQADAYVLCFEDYLLLDTEPETRRPVFEHLDRYIIADDVTLEDITEQTFALVLAGPDAHRVAGEAGLGAPNHGFTHVASGDFTIANLPDGICFYGPAQSKDALIAALTGAGAVEASTADFEAFRIVQLRPRYGRDITERSLPQETQQMQAVHFQKGCYLGQEIVERVRSRGHVNKLLTGFSGDGTEAPKPGDKVIYGGKEDGEVTSATAVNGHFYGIALVRAAIAQPGTMVGIDGKPATIASTKATG